MNESDKLARHDTEDDSSNKTENNTRNLDEIGEFSMYDTTTMTTTTNKLTKSKTSNNVTVNKRNAYYPRSTSLTTHQFSSLNENSDDADYDEYDNDDEDETEINTLRNKWRRSNMAKDTSCMSSILKSNSISHHGNELTVLTDSKHADDSIVPLSTTATDAAAADEVKVEEIGNTDASDPHWDGYTSSPFYSNSVTVDDICNLNDKPSSSHIQPILPWDELFFELEPIDDSSIKQNNVIFFLFIFLNFFL